MKVSAGNYVASHIIIIVIIIIIIIWQNFSIIL